MSFDYTIKVIMNNLHKMEYPFPFEVIKKKEYVDIVLTPIDKKVRFQRYPARFVITSQDDLYDFSVRRSVTDIGYQPMKGLQHYDFNGLQQELIESSILEPNIMINIFSYVDTIFKDVTTYTIHSNPDSIPFESRTRTLFLDENIRQLIYEITLELNFIWNPFDHFHTFLINILSNGKTRKGYDVKDILRQETIFSETQLLYQSYIQYNLQKGNEEMIEKDLIYQHYQDGSPIFIRIQNRDKTNIENLFIKSAKNKGQKVLTYENIEDFISYHR
jgi:hypothetical protein